MEVPSNDTSLCFPSIQANSLFPFNETTFHCIVFQHPMIMNEHDVCIIKTPWTINRNWKKPPKCHSALDGEASAKWTQPWFEPRQVKNLFQRIQRQRDCENKDSHNLICCIKSPKWGNKEHPVLLSNVVDLWRTSFFTG